MLPSRSALVRALRRLDHGLPFSTAAHSPVPELSGPGGEDSVDVETATVSPAPPPRAPRKRDLRYLQSLATRHASGPEAEEQYLDMQETAVRSMRNRANPDDLPAERQEQWPMKEELQDYVSHHPDVHVPKIVRQKFDKYYAKLRKKESQANQKTWNRMSKLERLIGWTGDDFEKIKKRAPGILTLDIARVIQPRIQNLRKLFPKCDINAMIRRAPRLLELETRLLTERRRLLLKALPIDDVSFNKMCERKPMLLQNRFEKTTRIKIWWIKHHAWDWNFEEALKANPWILKLGWGRLARLQFLKQYRDVLEARFVETQKRNASLPKGANLDKRGELLTLEDTLSDKPRTFHYIFPQYKDFLIARMEFITLKEEMDARCYRKSWDGAKVSIMEQIHGDWVKKKADEAFRNEFKMPLSTLSAKFEV